MVKNDDLDGRVAQSKVRAKELQQRFRGNAALFIPITELPRFMTGLSSSQERDLNKAIDILTEQQQPVDKVFFLGELALMPSPHYAPQGFFQETIDANNPDAPNKEPKYDIPDSALELMNHLMEENGLAYGALTSYPSNGWAELKKIKSTAASSGLRRTDRVRNYLMDHFGDEQLKQGLERLGRIKYEAFKQPGNYDRITLEFNLSSDQADFFENPEHIRQVAEHSDNLVKLCITRAFLRAMKSPIPTNDMHKEHLTSDIAPISINKNNNVLATQIELPHLFAGLVKGSLQGHLSKFHETQSQIGQELALSTALQQRVKTLNL